MANDPSVYLGTALLAERDAGPMELTLVAVRGDITAERVDAIVNAANSSLLGGGGVDGSIHAAAGPELLGECRELRRTTLPDGLSVGDAVATRAGRLPVRWVIHTVGPNRHAGQTDPALLASCFTRSLDVATDLGVRSVAFPAVSAGVYGWDAHDVARIAVEAVRDWGAARVGAVDDGVVLVRFVLFSDRTLAAFEHAMRRGPTVGANMSDRGR